MKFIHLFLTVYFLLVGGVALTLWQSGVLSRVDPLWIAIAVSIALGLAIVAAMTSAGPAATDERSPTP
jgi:hypothetical protein